MLCLRGLVDTNGWPRDVCSEPVLNWFSCFYALWNPAWSICMSTLHFLPAGSPWCLLCTDSLWGKCAQELIKVLPGSFLGSVLFPLVSQCVASEGGHMRLADLLFFLIYLLLKFWLQWPCYCWQGCFTLYSRVSEASPLQSYGFFMLQLKWRSDVIPRQKCLRLYFSHLQSSNFSWVILLYFHLNVWLLRWCLWAVLLALFFIETFSSVSKIYHLYSLFFVSSNLCDFVYLFQWSFVILFFLYLYYIVCTFQNLFSWSSNNES